MTSLYSCVSYDSDDLTSVWTSEALTSPQRLLRTPTCGAALHHSLDEAIPYLTTPPFPHTNREDICIRARMSGGCTRAVERTAHASATRVGGVSGQRAQRSTN